MRFYTIALFLFIFNASLGFVNGLGLSYQTQPINSTIWNPTGAVQNFTYSGPPEGSVMLSDIGAAFSLFFSSFIGATVALPQMLYNLGMPSELVTIIAGAVWLIYAAGIIELLTGRKP